MKRSFFQAAVTSILLYWSTTWTLTKRLEKKLDRNYTRMLRAILNRSWRQHPTRHQLYGHLPPITKTIQVRRTRHAGQCWRSRNEFISDVLLWTPTHGRAKAGRPARTYIQQLCEDTGCCPEDLPRAMNDREEWRVRVRDIRATSATWWLYIYIYIWITNIFSNSTFSYSRIYFHFTNIFIYMFICSIYIPGTFKTEKSRVKWHRVMILSPVHFILKGGPTYVWRGKTTYLVVITNTHTHARTHTHTHTYYIYIYIYIYIIV